MAKAAKAIICVARRKLIIMKKTRWRYQLKGEEKKWRKLSASKMQYGENKAIVINENHESVVIISAIEREISWRNEAINNAKCNERKAEKLK